VTDQCFKFRKSTHQFLLFFTK